MKTYQYSKFWIWTMIAPIIAGAILYQTIRRNLACDTAIIHSEINLKIVNNEILLNDSISLYKFVAVPGGNFTFKYKDTMNGEPNYASRIVPSILIGESEIPRYLYSLVMDGASAFAEYESFANHLNITLEDVLRFDAGPVICSFGDWIDFIHKLSLITGRHFTIPNIYEWYYVAQGGNSSNNHIYSGSDSIDSVCWYIGNTPANLKDPQNFGIFDEYQFAINSKSPNELGIYGMSGGAEEVVLYSRNPSNIRFNHEIQSGDDIIINHVGGSCNSNEEDCRVDILPLYTLYTNKNIRSGLRLILKY